MEEEKKIEQESEEVNPEIDSDENSESNIVVKSDNSDNNSEKDSDDEKSSESTEYEIEIVTEIESESDSSSNLVTKTDAEEKNVIESDEEIKEEEVVVEKAEKAEESKEEEAEINNTNIESSDNANSFFDDSVDSLSETEDDKKISESEESASIKNLEEVKASDNEEKNDLEKTDSDDNISNSEYDKTLSGYDNPKENKSNPVIIFFKKYLNKEFWKSFFFDTFFLVFCILFFLIIIQKWILSKEVTIVGTNQVHSSLESGEKTTIGNINVLVMGIDSVEGTHRSDTIFVLGINPSKNKVTMISIPRDTRVLIENKARKINEILPRYGEGTLRSILEDLLKIKINRKVEVGFESFISVIDAMGGIDINIEKAMNYDDNWGNLHIHFKAGPNHLDGQNALRYVRFRKDAMADLGRIKRQQDFVKKVIEKLCSPSCLVRLPSILETAFKYIKTDFTLQEILTVVKGFDNIKNTKFRTISLPGEPRYIDKISYFMPYSNDAEEIGNNYFSDLAIFELEKDYNIGRIIPKQSKSNRKNR